MSLLSVVLAQEYSDSSGDALQLRDLEIVFAKIIQPILGLAIVVLFVMLISGGFKYITSGGDPQRAGAARQTITFAIAGVALIASALLIIRLIEEITGANLSVFKIYID